MDNGTWWVNEEECLVSVLRTLKKRCCVESGKIRKIEKKKQRRNRSRYSNMVNEFSNGQMFWELGVYMRYLQFVKWRALEPEGNRESICRFISFKRIQ